MTLKKIIIPNPCPQNWDSMKETREGKFCEKCSMVVHDFTNKTSDEIHSALADNKNICGKFIKSQIQTTDKFWLKSIAIAISTGAISITNAQQKDSMQLQGFHQNSTSHPKYEKIDVIIGHPRSSLLSGVPPKYIINGKQANATEYRNLADKDIQTVMILKGDEAVKKYNEDYRQGVIIITTKKRE